MTQLYYLPEEERTITRAGLEAEIEYIAGIYPAFIETMISDMLDSGLAVEIQPGDQRAAFAEPEERTIINAQLFAEMSTDMGVMAEWADDDAALLEEIRTADDEILKIYKETFLCA